MEKALSYGVILAFILAFIALIYLIAKTFSYGKKKLYALPAADWKKGVIYAFGRGMMPWEKESAKKHLLTYFAGLLYHFGIFSGFLLLFTTLLSISLQGLALQFFRITLGLSLVCGLGLLMKRTVLGYMQAISCADDFVANILVDVFLLLAILQTFTPSLRFLFYVEAIFLLLYIPLGKIRHCFFFFYSRLLFGRFFGRRGVFPQARTH